MNEEVQNYMEDTTVSTHENESEKIQLNVVKVLTQLGIRQERWRDFIEDSSFFLRGQTR